MAPIASSSCTSSESNPETPLRPLTTSHCSWSSLRGSFTPRSSVSGAVVPTQASRARSSSFAEWARELVTASVSTEEWISSAVRNRRSRRSRSSRARKMLAQHHVHQNERDGRERERPGIRCGAQRGEHPDRHRAHPLKKSKSEAVAQVRPKRNALARADDEADECLADRRHRERCGDRCEHGPDRDLAR